MATNPCIQMTAVAVGAVWLVVASPAAAYALHYAVAGVRVRS